MVLASLDVSVATRGMDLCRVASFVTDFQMVVEVSYNHPSLPWMAVGLTKCGGVWETQALGSVIGLRFRASLAISLPSWFDSNSPHGLLG